MKLPALLAAPMVATALAALANAPAAPCIGLNIPGLECAPLPAPATAPAPAPKPAEDPWAHEQWAPNWNRPDY